MLAAIVVGRIHSLLLHLFVFSGKEKKIHIIKIPRNSYYTCRKFNQNDNLKKLYLSHSVANVALKAKT